MRIFVLQLVVCLLSFFSIESRAEDVASSVFLDRSYRWQISLGRFNQTLVTKDGDGSSSIEKKLTGDNFSVYFEIIKNETSYFDWQVNIGYEPFSLSNKESSVFCSTDSDQNCYVNINYLSAGILPRLKMSYTSIQFWTGVGLSIKQPLSKKASAVLESEIGATTTYGLALGADYILTGNLVLPIEVQQQYFFNSDTVKAQQFLIKIGMGRSF